MIERSLCGCFNFHSGLDNFLLRAGISSARLSNIRKQAEDQNKRSASNYDRAPKRLVVQQLLREVNSGTPDDDRVLAEIVTGLCKGNFPDATSSGKAAVNELTEERINERREVEQRRTEQDLITRTAERKAEQAVQQKANQREGFKSNFIALSKLTDHQRRGFLLEKFLNEFLDYEGLSPRGSFKIVGEQIDGSFSWAGRTYLVEAKWVDLPVGGAGFSSLMYKIEGKTADTRGLFISINGYSQQAIEGLKTKGELRFACIDGAHLMRCLEYSGSFPTLLEIIWRHANETGEAYIPVSSAAFVTRVT